MARDDLPDEARTLIQPLLTVNQQHHVPDVHEQTILKLTWHVLEAVFWCPMARIYRSDMGHVKRFVAASAGG
jgi:hypothetical protein